MYTWEKIRTIEKLWNGPGYYLKYQLQLKEKEKILGESGTQRSEVIRKSTVNKGKAVRFKSMLPPWIILSCELESSFSYWYREGDTLISGGFPYKCKCSFQKCVFHCFHQLKIIPMPKRHILKWHILLPFKSYVFSLFVVFL